MPLAIPEGRGPSGLVRVLSNDQIDKAASKKAEQLQNRAEITNLQTYISKHWESAKNTKWFVEERLLKCLRQRKGKYGPGDLAAIKEFGGSEVFMMLTNVKCRSIEAMIRDVMLPAGEKPWAVNETAIPDLPADEELEIAKQVQAEVEMIMTSYPGGADITPEMIDSRLYEIRDEKRQAMKGVAKKEARRIERHIEDSFQEGDLYKELSLFIKDFATYPTAFLKGPVVRRVKQLVWEDDPITGKRKPTLGWKNIRTWKRVNPFDIYMSAAAKSIHDGYLIERIRMRQSDLLSMKGVPGFDTGAIDQVLYEYNAGTLQDWLWTDQERANLENRPNEQDDPTAVIEALEYHGEVPGKLLKEWGYKGKLEDLANPVMVTCIMIGRWVIMARINEDPLGKKPYYSASFDDTPDSVWGQAPPELMEDCQRVCNAAARSIVNNAAIASGPQVEVHRDRLAADEKAEKIYPWKIWKTKSDPMGKNREAVHFYQPSPMTDTLMSIYEYFFGQAGEQLGVPAYEHGVGSQAGGAGKTAHGLSMLMNAASKIIKDAIMAIDTGIIRPVVYNTWLHIVLNDQIDYSGDINIVARASEYLIVAEQLQARRNEWLMATNNPTDMAIIGLDGRAKVLRESTKGLKMSDDIIPTQSEVEIKLQQMAQPGATGPDGMPVPGVGGGGRPTKPGLSEKLTPELERVANM